MRAFRSVALIAMFGVSLSSMFAFSAPDNEPTQKDLGTVTVSIVGLDGKAEEFTAPVFKRFVDAKDGVPQNFRATDIRYSPLKKKKCHSKFPVDCTRFIDASNVAGDFINPGHRGVNPTSAPTIEEGNSYTRYLRASSDDEIQNFMNTYDGYYALAIACIRSKRGNDGSSLTS